MGRRTGDKNERRDRREETKREEATGDTEEREQEKEKYGVHEQTCLFSARKLVVINLQGTTMGHKMRRGRKRKGEASEASILRQVR